MSDQEREKHGHRDADGTDDAVDADVEAHKHGHREADTTPTTIRTTSRRTSTAARTPNSSFSRKVARARVAGPSVREQGVYLAACD